MYMKERSFIFVLLPINAAITLQLRLVYNKDLLYKSATPMKLHSSTNAGLKNKKHKTQNFNDGC